MRRIFLRTAILIAALAVLSLLWVFGGRNLSSMLDRIGTAKMESRAVEGLTYEGTLSGGRIEIGGLSLSTEDPDFKPFPITFRPDSQQQFVATLGEKSFPLGPVSPEGDKFRVARQSGDKVSLTIRRSFLSWPTPFDFNFMTGHSPSWKRNLYYQLLWQKSSGQKLAMLWHYEQYFYPTEGWTNGMMTRQGSTGLIKASIIP